MHLETNKKLTAALVMTYIRGFQITELWGSKFYEQYQNLQLLKQTLAKYKVSTVSSTGTTSSNPHTPARASIAYGVQQNRKVP